jgi:hypothetical protein
MHSPSEEQQVSANFLTFGLDRNAPIAVTVPVTQADEQAQNKAVMGIAEILGAAELSGRALDHRHIRPAEIRL